MNHALTDMNVDIFCQVIDNYGDVATCWRLALALNQRHGIKVRLWVDELSALTQLYPKTQAHLSEQTLEQIHVHCWSTPFAKVAPALIVIEAFGCQLPENYRQAMICQQSLCINLEYFSCEPWVLGCHGLRSFQSDGLHKYFFFPGIVRGTGGVMFEADYEQQRLAFNPKQQQAWLTRCQLPNADEASIRISLFGYENSAIISLLEQAANSLVPIEFYCPISKLCVDLSKHYDHWQVSAGHSYRLGNCIIHFIPFLPQSEFDRLLWFCDLNFVRGEESLIRALLAAKPLVWHIYPTDDQAHWVKLEAFMQTISMAPCLVELNRCWNAQQPITNLPEIVSQLEPLRVQAQAYQQQLLALGDLSSNLVNFIHAKLTVIKTT